MSWFVLYIKPRNEIKVTDSLEKLGFKMYCPRTTQLRQWSDRKKKVEVALIPSYIFVDLEEKERNGVFQVPGVLRYVFWLGKPAIVRDGEIRALKESLKNNIIDVKIDQIQPGDHFLIPNGPFKGTEGIVSEISNNRIQLILKELGLKITLKKQAA